MAKIHPFPNKKDPSFVKDIYADGYHIFSLKSVKIPNFYRNKFPDYPGAKLSELTVGDRVTIRAFFRIGSGEPAKIDSGLIDLEVEHIDSDHIFGVIVTQLPDEFPLSTGDSLEIAEDEIINKIEKKNS
jgi:hypothetical protein